MKAEMIEKICRKLNLLPAPNLGEACGCTEGASSLVRNRKPRQPTLHFASSYPAKK